MLRLRRLHSTGPGDLLSSPRHIFLAICIALLAVFYSLNITGEHGWSDDGSVYIRHAQNLVAHRNYGDVLFTATPHTGAYQKVYPPLLPLALAPVVYFSGVNFTIFKREMYLFYLLSLALVPAALQTRMTVPGALAVVLLLGLNSNLLRVVDHVNANVLALLLNLLFVIIVQRSDANSFARGALAGSVAAAAFATSGIGVVAMGALVLYTAIRYRRMTRFLIAAAGVMIVLLALMHHSFVTEGIYMEQLRERLNYITLRRNVIQYPLAVATLLGASPILGIIVVLCFILGLIHQVRDGVGIWEYLAACHLAILSLWPFSDPYRFLLPIMPLIVYYIVTGFALLTSALPRRVAQAAVVLALAAVSASFVRGYFQDYRALQQGGIFAPESREIWQYVRNHTPSDSMILFRKQRTLSLLTGRHSAGFASDNPPGEDWADLCTVHPDYVLTAPLIFEDDRRILDPVLAGVPDKLVLAFSNPKFQLYAVKPGSCSPH
jgi:hypothetical protein